MPNDIENLDAFTGIYRHPGPKSKDYIIRQEALRRRLLGLCQACLPEWSKEAPAEILEELIALLLGMMPVKIAGLEADETRAMPIEAYRLTPYNLLAGCGTPPSESQTAPSRPAIPGAIKSGEFSLEAEMRERPKGFTLFAFNAQSKRVRVMARAQTSKDAAMWLSSMLTDCEEAVHTVRLIARTDDALAFAQALNGENGP